MTEQSRFQHLAALHKKSRGYLRQAVIQYSISFDIGIFLNMKPQCLFHRKSCGEKDRSMFGGQA